MRAESRGNTSVRKLARVAHVDRYTVAPKQLTDNPHPNYYRLIIHTRIIIGDFIIHFRAFLGRIVICIAPEASPSYPHHTYEHTREEEEEEDARVRT